jgi:O-methyltransferase involved in polyketide biosynthesis
MALRRALGGPTLEAYLLARHRLIDDLLARAIDDGSVRQVIELACGMAPRGWRFSERYGGRLTYVEADLPEMAERKRRALARMGSLSDRHRVVDVDVLRDDGPGSLAELAGALDHDQGVAIITEGLLTYFSQDDVTAMWRRFLAAMREFRNDLYLADLRLAGLDRGPGERAFSAVLSAFVRGRVYTHFADEEEAVAALHAAGFDEAQLHRGDEDRARVQGQDPGSGLVRVIEARAITISQPAG